MGGDCPEFYDCNQSISIVQIPLLDSRLWFQAAYRDFTKQIPSSKSSPPVVLIQIDEESLQKAKITDHKPIDQRYLAQIIDRLKDAGASVIGIDYLLPQPGRGKNSQVLSQSMQSAIRENQAWFILSSVTTPDGFETRVHSDIAQSSWSLSGEATLYWGYVSLPNSLKDCIQRCPMGYLLSLLWLTKKESSWKIQPSLSNKDSLQESLFRTITTDKKLFIGESAKYISHYKNSIITQFSQYFGQLWFAPILDFSIPKTLAFESILSKDLLDESFNRSLSDAIVIIGTGGYPDADDNFPQPSAQGYYWQKWREFPLNHLSGVELHGFAVHHLLTRRLVIPIPDVLLILFVGLAAKLLSEGYLSISQSWSRRKQLVILAILLAIYAGFCWQVFLSVAILVPWLYPSGTISLYFFSKAWEKKYVPRS